MPFLIELVSRTLCVQISASESERLELKNKAFARLKLQMVRLKSSHFMCAAVVCGWLSEALGPVCFQSLLPWGPV